MKMSFDQARPNEKRSGTQHMLQHRQADSRSFFQEPIIFKKNSMLFAVFKKRIRSTSVSHSRCYPITLSDCFLHEGNQANAIQLTHDYLHSTPRSLKLCA